MFAVIVIPHFSIQAVIRHEQDLQRPVALVEPEFTKTNIVQLNPAAEEQGISVGFTTNQALARCPSLVIKPRSRVQEQVATDLLLQTAYAFSPNIESTMPGVCTVGLKGLNLHTEDAMQKWGGKILQAVASFHLTGRIGIAPTPELALLAAQGKERVRVVQDVNKFIAWLPVGALRPPAETLEILERWGLRFVGEFIALGKDEIGNRLGNDGLEMLDKVCVEAVRPLRLVSPPADFFEQAEFEVEIQTADPLLFILQRFVEQLSRRVEAVHLVIGELHLRLGLNSGENYDRAFNIPDPTNRVAILFRMLQTHLENVRTNSPIVSLRLEARPCPKRAHQFGLFESTLRNPNQFSETLARLTALCGNDRVGTPKIEKTHRPDAFIMSALAFSEFHTRKSENVPEGLSLRRFRPAIRARIEFRETRPAAIHSPVLNAIVAEDRGPFRSSGDWWDKNSWTREEWDVQTPDGILYRVYRSQDGCFIEGVYD